MFDQSTQQEEIFENVAHGVIDKYIKFVMHKCLCFNTHNDILRSCGFIVMILFSLAVLKATMVPSLRTDR